MTAYKITYRQRAIKEYSESLAWYKKYSFQAAENFKLIIENTVNYIAQNPRSFKNSYKKFYIARTGRFPFIIVFFIEDERIIVITTIFHNKRNPAKKYRL